MRRQFARGLQLRGVYTYASNLDDGSAWNTSVSANTPAFAMYPGNPGLDYGPAATNIRHAAAINGTWELPFHHDALVNGWSLSGLRLCRADSRSHHNWATIQPAMETRAIPRVPTARLDLLVTFIQRQCSSGSVLPRSLRRIQERSATLAGTLMTGPGLSELDLALAKSTTIHERLRAQFRAEFFNVLNHSNFTTPNPVVYSSGPTPKTLTAAPTQSPTAGVISATATTSRQIQFGLKLLF